MANTLLASTFLGFHSYELWIMAIGILVCSSCGLIGCFLILRRLSLLGDAISHSVLPGIVIAVLITGSLNSLFIFIGAGAIGLLTPLLIDALQSSGRVHEDASVGAVFTILFAIGVIMVTNMGNIHLDTECILYGEIATTPFDLWTVSGIDMGPQPFWVLSTVFLINIAFVGLFYKELKLTSFDEALARSMGFRPRHKHIMH